jgi:periplasmic protein TonB
MFDRLLLSTKDRRKGRTGKFLFVTSLFYSLALASALVVSVIAASPQLYETMDVIKLVPIPPSPPPPKGGNIVVDRERPRNTPPPSIYNPEKFDDLVGKASAKPIPNAPTGPPVIGVDVGGHVGGTIGDPNGEDGGTGPVGSKGIGIANPGEGLELPPPPVTKPVEKPQTPVEKQIVRLTSKVLTGNAVERRTPAYPPLARQIRLEGSVTVEIFISPDGRVESARALNGHPLLMTAAVEAARAWRFQPTLLNGVAVRVTGVITFNFKLN